MITVRVTGADELAGLERRLRAAAGGLQGRAQDALRGTAIPVAGLIRARVASIDIGSSRGGASRSNHSTQLLARLAAATKTKDIPGGARFEVIGSEVDPVWGWRLAKLTDTELAPRWRHPVWGGRKWVGQTGQRWFFVTVRENRARFEAAERRVVERTVEQIMRGT